MKTAKTAAWIALCLLGISNTFGQPAETPAGPPPQDASAVLEPKSPGPPAAAPNQAPAKAATASATNLAAAASSEVRPPADRQEDASATASLKTANQNSKGLRMNFRGVPLDMVLNYLSDAAGFVIVVDPKLQGKINGRVDVWSNQPLSKQEAVDLLNKILNQNGYAAVRNGRSLTILTREDAQKADIPVKSGNDPKSIPKTDEMVTQIIPVQYANAPQLIQNLSPLLPEYAKLTANESGNALVLTGTQADIRRMAEIVKALDTSISSVSSIRVFPLQFADAKDLANSLKDLFQPPAQQGNNNRGQFFNPFLGGRGILGLGGGPGGAAGNAGGRGGSGTGTATGAINARVVAVADERTNSLIVSAPEDMMGTIEKLVKEIDVSDRDITEFRVFRLTNADPVEMADVLSQLFPDDSKSNDNNNNAPGFRFGRGPFGPGGPFNNNNPNDNSSDRKKNKGDVLAVADPRTASVIVSADSTLMPQIAEIIAQLDSNSAKKQRVYVYSLQNADPQEVEQVLQEMFQRNTTSMNRNSLNQMSPLMNRNQINNQNMSTGYGNTGFGNSSGLNNSGFGGGQR